VADVARTMTILVADDDPDLRDIMHAILEPAGFSVRDASDGTAALEAIRSHPPDLVILDYMMPHLTGPQVCEQVKQDLLLRHLPIIILTGKSETQDKVEVKFLAHDQLFLPGLQPAFALKESYLLFASSPDAVRRFAAAGASQRADASAEVPLLRLSIRELRRFLHERRDLLSSYAAEMHSLTRQEAADRLGNLIAALEFFDRLELRQGFGSGRATWLLRLQANPTLQK